jgi:prepilin-type N-terminal cleavage/methylation domain-containing protein
MRNNMPFIYRNGFTLVEMAIVLVIVGLLLAGLFTPLNAQLELRRTEETRVILDEAKDALTGFAVSNKFLPCPDVAVIPTGVEGARNGATNQCIGLEGVLPWQVLGVRAVDAWGRYIRYRVSLDFSNNVTFFTMTDTGDITVNSDTGILTTSAIAVLVSHGTNGFGGITTTQATPANQMPAPTGADELENSNGLNLTYISHTPTPQGSANEFDDNVTWISSTILVNRMVAAGQLP